MVNSIFTIFSCIFGSTNLSPIKMKNAFFYSLKSWFTTLLIAPLISFIIQRHNGECKYCDYREYYWSFIGELMIFFLLLPLILVSVILIKKKNHTRFSDKFLIIIVGIFLTAVNLFLLDFLAYLYKGLVINLYSFELLLTYSFLMGLALWFYKLKPETHDL